MSGVRVIAEPGTFYVSSSFTLVVNVIGKKLVAGDLHGESKGGLFNPSTDIKLHGNFFSLLLLSHSNIAAIAVSTFS